MGGGWAGGSIGGAGEGMDWEGEVGLGVEVGLRSCLPWFWKGFASMTSLLGEIALGLRVGGICGFSYPYGERGRAVPSLARCCFLVSTAPAVAIMTDSISALVDHNIKDPLDFLNL